MLDYKEMYFNLFNKVTDAIDVLQKAQQDLEEVYIINVSDEPLTISEIPEQS